jgi:hypothetical protein
MSQYRFLTTNLLTGQITGDWLPITAESLQRQISAAGTGTVALNLLSGNPVQNAANVAAVQPRISVLWCLQDGAVVWGGPIWDWNHESILDGTLPLGCSTMESVMAHRVIDTTFTYTNMDIFDMFRGLVQYAVSKTPNAQIAGLTYSPGESGITDTITFDGTQYQLVSDALTTLVQTYEIEYSFRPYVNSSGEFCTNVDLAYPFLGESFPASGLVYNFPGNLTDYAFQATGSTSANFIYATATNYTGTTDETLAGTAEDLIDLDAGYPLSEMAINADIVNWTTNAQVAAYAQGYLPTVTDTQLTPLLTMPGGLVPTIAQTVLGSSAQLSLTSALHPAGPDGTPGYTGLGRVTGWTLMPPGPDQEESAQIAIGNMTMTP